MCSGRRSPSWSPAAAQQLVGGLLEDAHGKPASPEDGAANGVGGLTRKAVHTTATTLGASGLRNRRRSRILSDELAFERAEAADAAADGEGGDQDAALGAGVCSARSGVSLRDVLGYRFDQFFGNWKTVCMLLITTVSLAVAGCAYWLAGCAADMTESVWKVSAAAVVATIFFRATVVAPVPERPCRIQSDESSRRIRTMSPRGFRSDATAVGRGRRQRRTTDPHDETRDPGGRAGHRE